MGIDIFTSDDQADGFYAKLGPFFADKRFFKIFGESLYNEPGSVWFVFTEKDKVVGFCSAFKNKTHVLFNQLFIEDEYRDKSYCSKLFAKRMAYFKDEKDIRSMVRDKKMLKLYSENGFKAYGKRGSYTLLKREI